MSMRVETADCCDVKVVIPIICGSKIVGMPPPAILLKFELTRTEFVTTLEFEVV